jgi:hypothetical protein
MAIIYYALRVTEGDYPVGFTMDQRAQVFSHAFHNFVPDEGWLFAEDGAHHIPA